MSVGRAAVLAVFCASVYFDIWGMMGDDTFLLSLAFVIAFLAADEPLIQYKKMVTIEKEEKKKE